MIIPKLQTELTQALTTASEIYIAVALIKDRGLRLIENSIPDICDRHYLVGIDLPTTPSVLYRLNELKEQNTMVKARIYTSSVYHPKVYIIKNNIGKYVAFVGSGNATSGGFGNNVEMAIKVEDQRQCISLLNWFNELFKDGIDFNEAYVEAYEKVYWRNAVSRSRTGSDIDQLLNRPDKENGMATGVPQGQFLNQDDFDAFAPIYHSDDSEEAKDRRRSVRDKLLELDEIIFPEFMAYGITDLHRHPNSGNRTSQYFHSRGSKAAKDAIWLHYGKSSSQLNGERFTDTCRVQLILRNTAAEAFIGIWLFVGKPKSSWIDRQNLKDKLNDKSFKELFYRYYLDLGNSYWINIDSAPEDEVLTDTVDNFKATLQKDDFSGYYIIGRNYHPGDSAFSTENIKETVLVEFGKMFKLYKLIISQ